MRDYIEKRHDMKCRAILNQKNDIKNSMARNRRFRSWSFVCRL